MKREVKFRVWDGKAMYSNPAWMVEVSDGTVWLNTGSHGVDALESREVELMQFTGLKDKNGVEIYEGDIIKGEYADGDAFAPIAVEDMCWLHKMTVLGDAWRRLEANTVEVIGNIHENPDLLETK